MIRTINIVMKLEDEEVVNFENKLRDFYDVVDFKFLPETDKLYKTDKTFQKLVKAYNQAREEKNKYINEKNI